MNRDYYPPTCPVRTLAHAHTHSLTLVHSLTHSLMHACMHACCWSERRCTVLYVCSLQPITVTVTAPPGSHEHNIPSAVFAAIRRCCPDQAKYKTGKENR